MLVPIDRNCCRSTLPPGDWRRGLRGFIDCDRAFLAIATGGHPIRINTPDIDDKSCHLVGTVNRKILVG